MNSSNFDSVNKQIEGKCVDDGKELDKGHNHDVFEFVALNNGLWDYLPGPPSIDGNKWYF